MRGMRLPVPTALIATLALAGASAGCGDDVDPVGGGAPAVTAPGTTVPFEAGGGDGSGGDGLAVENPQGGIAGGPDAGTR